MNFSKLEKEFYDEVCTNIKDFPLYEINKIKDDSPVGSGNVNYDHAIEKLRKLQLSEDDLEALEKVIRHGVSGAIHSIFVTIDGGTALSDNGKALELVNAKTGVPITEGALHENFMFNIPDEYV